MDLSKSTTEDDLLDMLGGDDKARKTSTDSMSDPFAEVGLEQEQEQAAEPKLEASTPATPIVPPTPPSAATVNTGNSPAPEINDKAITAQAKFLEVRRVGKVRGSLLVCSLVVADPPSPNPPRRLLQPHRRGGSCRRGLPPGRWRSRRPRWRRRRLLRLHLRQPPRHPDLARRLRQPLYLPPFPPPPRPPPSSLQSASLSQPSVLRGGTSPAATTGCTRSS